MICFSSFLSNAWHGEPCLVLVRVSSRSTCAVGGGSFSCQPFLFLILFFFSCFLCLSACLLCSSTSFLFRLFAVFGGLPRWGSSGPWGDRVCGVAAWDRLYFTRDISLWVGF